MKISYLTSYSDKEDHLGISIRIKNHLQKQKHEVFEKSLSAYIPEQDSTIKITQWYSEWSDYIKKSDFVIVEGSYPSTIQIGFETGMILWRGKPVVLLYKTAHDPVFINNLQSPRLIKSEYDDTNLEEVLDWCLEEVKELSNRRFTFFISPEIENFLDEVVSQNGTTRSEFIRGLIENEMFKRK